MMGFVSRKYTFTGGVSTRAMTLLEVLMVVILLGILTAITYPVLSGSLRESKQQSFFTSLQSIVRATQYYHMKTGEYPQSPAPGQEPVGMSTVVAVKEWSNETPLGGAWMAQRNIGGVRAAVGVQFAADTAPDAQMLADIDNRFDDGNLNAGNVRSLGGGLYYVLEE